jgi:thiamine pyrophosphate-dependent acetolactate synthase large subunit-like protein
MRMLNRRIAVRELLHDRGELVVVAGLGAPAYDLASCGDEATDFPLWGAMGGAVMVGLGVAISRPERAVLVLTGDGELLMGLGSLATVALAGPKNLSIAVIDNERYGETGGQATATAAGTDLAGVAKACGIKNTRTVTELDDLPGLRRAIHVCREPLFAVLKVSAEAEPRVLPPRDGAYLSHRLRSALLGDQDTAND